MNKKNYTPYHMHSMISNGVTNIDSITNFRLYVEAAKNCGMKAMGFSEHGCVFEWLHKKETIEKAGMKYIHAVEAYITEDPRKKVRDNYHCVLIARNYDGFLELNELVSKSFNRATVKVIDDEVRFYYMPRITYAELEKTSDNIIITTACLGGILGKAGPELKNRFICFLKKNKHRCFLEIQHHNDTAGAQREYNQKLYKISQEIGVPLIAGTDTHALNDLHMKGRSILQKAKDVYFADEDSWDMTFKTYEELVAAYEKQGSLPMDVVLEAIENTNRMADMVEEFEIDRSYKYPHLWPDPMKTFREKIEAGIKRRGVDKFPNYQEYLDRVEYETEAYVHNGAIDFMLLMEDIIDWCNHHDIKVGYGRGSSEWSVIAWLLGITEMDSIKHKLNFERFLNIERVSLSDIDTDFPPSRIEEVKQYIFSKPGLYCCDIVTFNTVADKGAIRDVGRALGIPLKTVGTICDAVDNEEEYAKVRQSYKELFEYVDLIKGTIVSVGSHPCGTVVSPFSVTDRFGTFTSSTSNYPISQINMKEIDSLNFVKLDLLKLDTIELINDTCKLAGIERLTPDNVDINDVKVWDAIRDDTTQIFQWEGSTGDSYIKKLLSDKNIERFKEVNEKVDRMTLLSIGNSAIRPAGASYRDDLANGVVRKTGSKPIDDFLSPTFGYLVFQCQIIDFLHLYCGFTMGEADIVRRGFAKKTGTDKYIPIIKDGGYMNDSKSHYISGFIKTMKEKYGISEEKSEEDIVAFIKVIEDASSYLFSLNHSQPYSYEGYVSGYLRTYYPVEFLTVALNINKDKEEKTRGLIAYVKSHGIKLLPPKFRHSQSGYFCDVKNKTIYKGIGSIKFMNDQVADQLYELRNNQYDCFGSLLVDLKEKTKLNAKQLDILIKIDFFEEFGDINMLLYLCKVFDLLYKKAGIKKNKLQEADIPELYIRRNSQKETKTQVTEIDYISYLASKGIDDYESELSDCIKFKYIPDERAAEILALMQRESECLPDDSDELLSIKNRMDDFMKSCNKIKVPNGYSFTKIFKKYMFTSEELRQFATKTVYGGFEGINVIGLLGDLQSNMIIPPCSLNQKIQYEISHLGYIEYTNPDLSKRYIVITDLDSQYSPKFKAYCLKNGSFCEMRIHKKKSPRDKEVKATYADAPFENGDILFMRKCSQKPKQRRAADGHFEVVPGEYNWWIDDYYKLENLQIGGDCGA